MLVDQTFFNEFIHGGLIDRIGQCVQGANRFEHVGKQFQFLSGVLPEGFSREPRRSGFGLRNACPSVDGEPQTGHGCAESH